MYKVYCDGKTLYEPQNKELTIIDPVVELELNTAGSFTFTMPPEHPFYDSIDEMKSYIRVTQINVNGKDEEEVFAGRAYQVTTDMWKRKTVVCEGVLAYLGDTIQRPYEYHIDGGVSGNAAQTYLNGLIANHNSYLPDDTEKHFTVGYVSPQDDYIYCYTNMQSTWTEIKEDLVDDLGGYLKVVNYYNSDGSVNYHELDYCIIDEVQNQNTYGDECSQYIEFGENLLDFTQDLDLSDIATALLPLGATIEYDEEDEKPFTGIDTRVTLNDDGHGGKAQDSDYLTIPEAVEKYGLIMKTETWDDCTTCEGLLQQATKWLESYQWEEMTLEVKAVDLHYTDEQFERFRLGDTVRVISKPHGLDRWFPIAKMSINLLTPANNTITLGTTNGDRSLSGQTNEVKQGVELIPDVDVDNILTQARNAATALMNMHSNGVITTLVDDTKGYTTDLYIMTEEGYKYWSSHDQTGTGGEPLWIWNVDGLAYYGNGLEGGVTMGMISNLSDGGGIVANSITTGTMTGIEIYAGKMFSNGTYSFHASSNGLEITGDTDTSYANDYLIKCKKNASASDYVFSVTNNGTLYAVSGTVGGFTLSDDSLTSNGLKLYVDSTAEQLSAGYIEETVIKGLVLSDGTYYTDFYTRFGLVDNSKNTRNAEYYGDDQDLAIGYAQYTKDDALIGGMYLQPYKKSGSETDDYYYMEVLRLGYGGPYEDRQTGHPYFRIDGIYDVPDDDSNYISAWIQTKSKDADHDTPAHLVLAPQGSVYQQAMWQSPNAWHDASIVFKHLDYLRDSSASTGTYPGYNLDTWAFRPCTSCGYQEGTAFELGTGTYGWERLYIQPADKRDCGIWLNDGHSSGYSGDREHYFMLGRCYSENTAYYRAGTDSFCMHYMTLDTSTNDTLTFEISNNFNSSVSAAGTSGGAYLFGAYTSSSRYLGSRVIAAHSSSSYSSVTIDTDNGLMYHASSSSERYKHDITELNFTGVTIKQSSVESENTGIVDEIKGLYDLPVVTFKYNEDYLEPKDERYDRDVVGLIAERLEEVLPIAVDHNDEGLAEKWNSDVLVPCLLGLIQDLNTRVKNLENRG